MRCLRKVAPLLVLCAVALKAQQQPPYVPSQELPKGREIVAGYFGSESCGPCHAPEVKDGVVRMKELLRVQALKAGAAFSVVGVANDWDQKVAAAFLEPVGPFDQVVLGGNWTNVAIEQFIWRDPQGQPVMPQILVVERTVTTGAAITFTPPRTLRRLVGPDSIAAWVKKGAAISP